jgi:hypothetical protein
VEDDAPAFSVQLEFEKLPLAVPLLKVTVPTGAVFVPDAESLTVAVHVLLPPYVTGFGEQLTLVVVDRAEGGAFDTLVVSDDVLLLPLVSLLPLAIVAVFVMLPIELGAVTTIDFVRSPLLGGMSPAKVQVIVFPVIEQLSAAVQPDTYVTPDGRKSFSWTPRPAFAAPVARLP